MDYTVGSVADLISGKGTSNKPKVFKKVLPKPNVDEKSSQELKPSPKSVPGKVGKTGSSSLAIGKTQKFKKLDKRGNMKKNKDIKASEDKDSLTVILHDMLENMEKKVTNKSSNYNVGGKKVDKSNYQNDEQKTHTDVRETPNWKNPSIKKEVDDETPNWKNPSIKEEVDDETPNRKNSSVKKEINDETPNWKNPSVKKEVDSRTVFVGNVGIAVKKTQLLKFFGKFGKIQSVRLRCATPANPGMSKRVAVIKKMLHPKRATLHSYITFENREDALKALEVNGTKYKEHHLRVQMCDDEEKPDAKKAIFVGNLPFNAEDDDLWGAFEQFGPIKSVRVVRNAATGMGIGIGYVNFDSLDSVELALQMQDITVKNKVVRIKRYVDGNRKDRKRGHEWHKKILNKSREQENSPLKQKNHRAPSSAENQKLGHKEPVRYWNQTRDQEKSQRKHHGQKNKNRDNAPAITVKNSVFQGSKSDKKKQKPKVNRGFIQKLKLAQKIAPKTAKS